jgi:hypothetical protein
LREKVKKEFSKPTGEKAGVARERGGSWSHARFYRDGRKTLVRTRVLHTQKYDTTIKNMVLNTKLLR